MTQWDASSESFIRNQHYGCVCVMHTVLLVVAERRVFFFSLLITCFCKLITNHRDFFERNYKRLMERCEKMVNGFKNWYIYIYFFFFLLESTDISPGNIS